MLRRLSVGVFRVRLNRSAQSGSARQVLQSLQGVGQTRVMGDMVHMVESCVNDFWALSTASATRHSSLNLSKFIPIKSWVVKA